MKFNFDTDPARLNDTSVLQSRHRTRRERRRILPEKQDANEMELRDRFFSDQADITADSDFFKPRHLDPSQGGW
jgi:hypothetical protein